MQKLNLPAIECKIRESGGKTAIFDFIRKKYVTLTPEEWVRQHILHLLVSGLQYPAALIRLEGGLIYENLNKRSDILVFDRSGLPHLLVECKAPEVPLSAKTMEQASRYNKTWKAPFLVVTNGLKTYCFRVDFETGDTVQLATFPEAPA